MFPILVSNIGNSADVFDGLVYIAIIMIIMISSYCNDKPAELNLQPPCLCVYYRNLANASEASKRYTENIVN